MRQYIFFLALSVTGLFSPRLHAQLQMRGLEAGPWVGTAYYLGDLNTEFRFNRPNLAGGIAARYNFNHRLAARASMNFGRVEARDSDSENTFERERNLSFYSDIYDLTGQFEFNFLPYFHGSREYFFTPYAFVGFSVFGFNPKTTIPETGQTIVLQPLGTEGQAEGSEYHRLSAALAYGVGIRWDLTYELSMDVSLTMRNTLTDYLDDVSTIYPDRAQLQARRGDLAARMSDRSLQNPDGGRVPRGGTQRGDDSLNDHYLMLGIGINYYFGDVLCPKVVKGRKPRIKRARKSKRR
ncbi:DUF6089 family protein [Lewinella sp. IMCC34183]|uniref:type IX secretion system protein PorG n=1 Tax=Lewinella sp. IMCC34183 TaxID=2248762 RepID=UPI001E4BED2F|nr:DUF6089 family protein [Lewinella sp. IMCC34183]